MKKRMIVGGVAAVLGLGALAGYAVIKRQLLGHSTTEQAVLQAIKTCGLSPNDLLWKVEEGTLFVGSKYMPGTVPNPVDTRCLTDWALKNNVRLGFIGWEQTK